MTKFGPNKTKKHFYLQVIVSVCVIIIVSFLATVILLTVKPELKEVISNFISEKASFITSRTDTNDEKNLEFIGNTENAGDKDNVNSLSDLPPDLFPPPATDRPTVEDEDGYSEEPLITDPLPTDHSVSHGDFSSSSPTTTRGESNNNVIDTSITDSTSGGFVSSSPSPSSSSSFSSPLPPTRDDSSNPTTSKNVTSNWTPTTFDGEEEVNPNDVTGEVIRVSNFKLPPVDELKGQPIVIKTPLGKVKGIQGEVFGKKVNAFLGIPFAEPPVGNLRFKRTVKVKPWRGILEATKFKPHCPQLLRLEVIEKRTPLTHMLAEDCLYLNIWTPNHEEDEENSSRTQSNAKKPVMLWFFGGGYAGGTNNLDEFDGRVLASLGDVIVVTANYRLGSFGFLDLGINDSPGNQGLYDNKRALLWVRSNIEAFGGDPEQITLFGNSAGAISIGLMMVHNHTSTLFKRAILQSGSPVMLNFFFTRTEETAERFVELMNCSHHIPEGSTTLSPGRNPLTPEEKEAEEAREFEIFKNKRQHELNCLMTKSTSEIIAGQKELLETAFPFTPSPYEQFLPLMATEALKADFGGNAYRDTFNGVSEVLLGSNRDEGSVILHLEIPEIFKIDSVELNMTTLTELKELLVGNFSGEFNIDPETARVFAGLFFVKGPENDSTINLIRRLYQVIGGLAFTCPVASFAEGLTTRGKTVYQYEFGYRSSATPWGEWMGVTHGDEYIFTFGHPLRYPSRYSKEDMEVSQRMIHIWSHFAKTG